MGEITHSVEQASLPEVRSPRTPLQEAALNVMSVIAGGGLVFGIIEAALQRSEAVYGAVVAVAATFVFVLVNEIENWDYYI